MIRKSNFSCMGYSICNRMIIIIHCQSHRFGWSLEKCLNIFIANIGIENKIRRRWTEKCLYVGVGGQSNNNNNNNLWLLGKYYYYLRKLEVGRQNITTWKMKRLAHISHFWLMRKKQQKKLTVLLCEGQGWLQNSSTDRLVVCASICI